MTKSGRIPGRPAAASRRFFSILITAALVVTGLVALPSIAEATRSPAPYETTQLITVNSPSAGSSYATLSAWQRNSDGTWTRKFGPVAARVGGNGIGHASEGSDYTPAGTFPLTVAFGRLSNPGTKMNYFTTDSLDWWDENPSSPTYNLHVRRSSSPGGASENLYYSGTAYNYGVNIGYNLSRVPGAGSAFFLHVGTGSSTAGCVSIDQGTLANILRWLDPAKHPYIDIHVGSPLTPTRSYTPTQATNMAKRLIDLSHPSWTAPGHSVPSAGAWATLLLNGYSLAKMANTEAISTTRLRYTVAQAYQRCLGRNPSSSELVPYVNALAHGTILASLYGVLCGSDAAWKRFGSTTDGWIKGMVLAITGHQATSADLAKYRARLASAGRHEAAKAAVHDVGFEYRQLNELYNSVMGKPTPNNVLSNYALSMFDRGWFTLVSYFANSQTFVSRWK